MKKMLLIFLIVTEKLAFAQSIDINSFNSSSLNNLLLKEINNMRKERNLDTLIYSKTLFDSLSYPNCIEVVKKCDFYHPDVNEKLKRGAIKKMIALESNALFNDTVVTYNNGIPWVTYYENAFRTAISSDLTYAGLVELAIESWEKSPEHKKTQNLIFESGNLPGFFSCHSDYAKNGYVYIYINYVLLHRQ
jgi:hypothetical protein